MARKVPLPLTVREDVKAHIENLAKARGRSRNDVTEYLIDLGIKADSDKKKYG